MNISTADDDVRYVPDEHFAPGDFCSIAHESRYQWLAENYNLAGKLVLDFGCGSGYGANFLAGKARSVQGVDISDSAIRHASASYSGSKNLQFMALDLTMPDLNRHIPSKFDVIVSFDVVEHVEQYWRFIANIESLLAEGGVAVIGCPNRLATFRYNTSWNMHHVQEFTPSQLYWLLKQYFQQVEILGQDFRTSELREACSTALTQHSSGVSLKRAVLGSIKQSLPESALNLLRKARSGVSGYRKYTLDDMRIARINLDDPATCEQPFGLVATCSR